MTNTNTSLLNFEYSFIIDPKVTNPHLVTYYESNIQLWKECINDQTGLPYRMIDNLFELRQIINQINLNQAKHGNYINLIENNNLIIVSFNGSIEFINKSRNKILQTYNQVNFKTISMTPGEFMKINEKFTLELYKLSNQYQVEIVINNDNSCFSKPSTTVSHNSGYAIHILGNQDNITIAETSVRILIDTLINNNYLDSIDIELSLIPIIGGKQLINFNQIAKQTNSNIYIPDLLPNLFNSKILIKKLWITSKSIPEILLTKQILNKIIAEKKQLLIKEVDIKKVKLDLITLYNQSDILNIMFDKGIFIQLPNLGSKESKVLVQGTCQDIINDVILELNLICSNYYTVELNGNNFNNNEYALIQLISSKKSCVINSTKYGLDINGQSGEIKQLLHKLSTNLLNLNIDQIKLRIELNNSQKDFISGKKNGKLIKILNQLNNNQLSIIKFRPFNEYNFFIDFEINNNTDLNNNKSNSNNNIPVLLKGLELIELELPAELNFNIPEVFHKSIIGNGGLIIQSIMKKYNVFIKFSNSNVNNSLNDDIYSFKRFDNVLIKCPRKNERNIQLAKYEIDQLVLQCCLNNMIPVKNNSNVTIYNTLKFQLLKSHYLLLINNNKIQHINELEIETNSFINFPTSIEEFNRSSNLIMDIKGADTKIKQCFNKLKMMLPMNYEFKITFNSGKFDDNFFGNYKQDFYDNIVIPFKVLLGIEILINETPLNNQNHNNNNNTYHQIILSYFEQDKEKLNAAIDSLTIYLRQKGFLILDKGHYDFNPLMEEEVTIKPSPLQPLNSNHYNNTPPPLLQPKGRKIVTNFNVEVSPHKTSQYVHYIS
ncbi:hypothetical protein DFJ63DRAFT_310472 [Scheffersomyces coipomensis]|uniref:uncharacterized protein n=1 Tax=Scheffersomyces coipomensis TaxID=1788519 RepID=UPI00315CC28E